MTQPNYESIEHQLERLETRLDNLSTKMDTYQYGNLQLIHTIDKKVDSHSKIIEIFKYVAPPGVLLAIFGAFKDWLPK